MASHRRSLIFAALFSSMMIPLDQGLADIYRYVDEKGVIHFTNVPTHNKFKLIIRERPYRSSRRNYRDWLRQDFFKYDSFIEETCKKYGIDFNLAKAIIKVESDFDKRAISRKGARGLMQLMPETARELGVRNIFDPEENIEGGVRHLRSLLDTFRGNLPLALAAYNAGKESIFKYRYRIPPYYETRSYVRKVLQYFNLYRNNGAYPD